MVGVGRRQFSPTLVNKVKAVAEFPREGGGPVNHHSTSHFLWPSAPTTAPGYPAAGYTAEGKAEDTGHLVRCLHFRWGGEKASESKGAL